MRCVILALHKATWLPCLKFKLQGVTLLKIVLVLALEQPPPIMSD